MRGGYKALSNSKKKKFLSAQALEIQMGNASKIILEVSPRGILCDFTEALVLNTEPIHFAPGKPTHHGTRILPGIFQLISV